MLVVVHPDGPTGPYRPSAKVRNCSMLRLETKNASLRKAFRENNKQPLQLGFDYADLEQIKAEHYTKLGFTRRGKEIIRAVAKECGETEPKERWNELVDWWSHPNRVSRSLQNAANRSKNTIITHQGKKSFPQGRNEYLDMKAMQDRIKAGLISFKTDQEILDEVVPSDNRQNMSNMGRKLPGGGSTSRRKQAEEAHARAYLASLKADAADQRANVAYQNTKSIYGALDLARENNNECSSGEEEEEGEQQSGDDYSSEEEDDLLNGNLSYCVDLLNGNLSYCGFVLLDELNGKYQAWPLHKKETATLMITNLINQSDTLFEPLIQRPRGRPPKAKKKKGTTSTTRNPSRFEQIAQPGMNLGQDNQMQMVRGNGGNQFRQYAGQNVGNQNENGNVVAARAEDNANGNNGNQIRCYNCRGLGQLARNCTVRPRRRDAAYLQTRLLIAQKEEAGIQLQGEEFDLMVAVADLDEIEEVNANCILMANLQQASTSGTQTDKAPVYDSDGSAEVQLHDNCYNDEIFNMFTQEEHVEQSGGTVEQHPATVEETRAYFE
ncbi:hypothetical protein Tco_0009834 [Tanacetum coccineum]